MDIYLLRHGIAEDRTLEVPDASRKLTPKGEKQLRRVLAVAKKAGVEPDWILTSPLRRAQETAAIASEVLECSRVRETRALLPEAEPESIWVELQDLDDASSVLLAGHEPHMSSLLSYILGVPLNVEFKKGALVCVAAGISGAALQWMLTARLTRA